MRSAVVSLLSTMLLVGIFAVPRARADEWDQLTRFTFTQPVEVPGKTLPAGTYWFRLFDSPSNRGVVEIFNADQSRLCATVLTASAWREHSTVRTELSFAERRHDKPEAILSWFYPGDRIGHEFLYPLSEEKRLDRDPEQKFLVPRADSHNPAAIVIVHHGE